MSKHPERANRDRVRPTLHLGDEGLFIAAPQDQLDRLFHFFEENGIACGFNPAAGKNILLFHPGVDAQRIQTLFTDWVTRSFEETVEFPPDEGTLHDV